MSAHHAQACDPSEPPVDCGGFRPDGRPHLKRLDQVWWALAGVGVTLALSVSGAAALDCDDAVTTPDLNACAERDYQAADRRLNEAYRQAQSRIEGADLPPEGQRAHKQALQDAQRKWLLFRDADCELARFEVYGGTMATMLVIGCLTKRTEGRIKDLQGIAAPQ